MGEEGGGVRLDGATGGYMVGWLRKVTIPSYQTMVKPLPAFFSLVHTHSTPIAAYNVH